MLWAFLTLMGGTASVLGSRVRLKTDDPSGLLWGLFLGGISGGALVLVGGDTLAVTSERLFGNNAGRQPAARDVGVPGDGFRDADRGDVVLPGRCSASTRS